MNEAWMLHIRKVNAMSTELDALYHQAAWKLGLSDSVFGILYILCEYGDGCMINDICRLSGCCKQTINSALRSMEKKDWIYLKQCGGKTKRVHLTEQGRALMNRTVARFCAAESNAYEGWTFEEVKTFASLMEKYVSCLRMPIDEL